MTATLTPLRGIDSYDSTLKRDEGGMGTAWIRAIVSLERKIRVKPSQDTVAWLNVERDHGYGYGMMPKRHGIIDGVGSGFHLSLCD